MKICVLGSAPSSVHLAPFKNTNYRQWLEGRQEMEAQAHAAVPGDFEVWGCSPAAWAVSPRATRWFEVHRWEPGQAWFSPEYCQFLRNFTGTVYTGGRIPEIQNHVVYPIDEMEAKFSSYFMTSSLALMTALAVDTIEKIREARAKHKAGASQDAMLPLGVDQDELENDDSDDVIGMWGVDMAATEEYGYQRPGCQFFVLEALRRGIGFYIPPESDLMRPMPVYGISEWDHNYIKLTSRARELSGKGNHLQAQAKQAAEEFGVLQGQMQALNMFVHTWTSPYGLQPGMVVRQLPGTGLGSGITHYDGRPIERQMLGNTPPPAAPALAAMAESEEAQAERALAAKLMSSVDTYRRQIGAPEGATPEALMQRLLLEAQASREQSALLQRFVHPGESTPEAIVRILKVAVGKGRPKKRR